MIIFTRHKRKIKTYTPSVASMPGGEYSINVYTGRLRSEVQPITLFYYSLKIFLHF